MTPPKSEQELKRAILDDADRIARLDAGVENRIMKLIDDHETRLRDMEKWQWKMMGIGLCVGFLMTVFTGVATWTITDDIRQIREKITGPVRR